MIVTNKGHFKKHGFVDLASLKLSLGALVVQVVQVVQVAIVGIKLKDTGPTSMVTSCSSTVLTCATKLL